MKREVSATKPCFWDSVDVHLLRVLEALLTECNVSRAARRMNQSQPAMSTALRRLRDVTGDQLLVRAGASMVPTGRAAAMLQRVRLALGQIESLMVPEAKFEPAQSMRIYNVAAPDYISARLLGQVVARMRKLAPHSRIIFHALASNEDFRHCLETDTLDAVIGNWPSPPESLRMAPLFKDEIVCLMRSDHPLANGPLTVERYLQAEHVAPTLQALGRRDIIDAQLARSRHERTVVAYVPYFNAIPHVLLQTDLLFTGLRTFSEQLTSVYPLHMTASPLSFPPVAVHLLWHNRTHHAPEAQWFRTQIVEIIRTGSAGRAPGGPRRLTGR